MEDRAAFGTAVDLSPRAGLPSLPALVGVLHSSGEFQVAMHGSAAYGLRLVPATAPRARPPPELQNATSIVSGGTKVTHATAHCRVMTKLCYCSGGGSIWDNIIMLLGFEVFPVSTNQTSGNMIKENAQPTWMDTCLYFNTPPYVCMSMTSYKHLICRHRHISAVR